MTSKVGPIRHAPWSKFFKTFYCHGNVAHELQVGPLVIQVFYISHPEFGRLHVWRDMYWRR